MTATFKQFKTRKLGIVLQVTETTPPGADGRRFEVHDVERNRGFRVAVANRALQAAKPKRAFGEGEIEAAIGLAIERALLEPPEKLPGNMYDVDVTNRDLQESSG